MTRSRSGKKRWVRTVVVGGALAALAVAGLLGYRAWRGTDEVTVTYVTKQAEKITLISSVSGTGNVVLGQTESVSPRITGEVAGLSIEVGDTVTEGQLLFVLVNPQLDLSVASATASYNQAEQKLEQAELSVLKAEQTLSQLKKQRAAQSSSSAEASSNVTVAAASSVAVTAASTEEVSVAATDSGPVSRLLASVTTTPLSLEPPSSTSTLPVITTTTTGQETTSTTAEPETTSTTHPPATTTTSTPNPPSTTPTTNASTTPSTGGSTGTTTGSTVTALDIQIAAAQVTSTQVDVTVAQNQVDSAAYALEQATENAAARQVTAPMDGTVTVVGVTDGDRWGGDGSGGTSSGTGATSTSDSSSASTSAAVVISDLESFETTVALGETDIVGVKVGDKVTLTFDALPDLTLVGNVESVATSGTVSQGVVSYDVTIVPGTGNGSVKAGMTVTAEIITLSKVDVLAVPNAAVKTDSSGGSYVQILTDGKPVTQTVEVGMASEAYTEITTGLTSGQAVVTQTVGGSTTNTTSGRSSGGILGTGSGLGASPPDGGGPPPGFGGGG